MVDLMDRLPALKLTAKAPGKPMGFHSPLIRPYLLGGMALGGGNLDSHDSRAWKTFAFPFKRFCLFSSGILESLPWEKESKLVMIMAVSI